MRKITIVNEESGRTIKLRIGNDSILSAHQVRIARLQLCPTGFQPRGVLGEYGEQIPPDVPGHRFKFVLLPSGACQVVAERVAE